MNIISQKSLDKKRKGIILIEIGIMSQDGLQAVKTEKKWKYDKLGANYRCPTKIIRYVVK